MKELYIAPELKITCFAPVERLANTTFDGIVNFGDVLKLNAGQSTGASRGQDDLDVGL